MENVLMQVNYISCEGNDRWFTIIVPEGTDEYIIESRTMRNGGMGDDPAEFVSVEEYPFNDGDYNMADDWTDINENYE